MKCEICEEVIPHTCDMTVVTKKRFDRLKSIVEDLNDGMKCCRCPEDIKGWMANLSSDINDEFHYFIFGED